MHDAPGACIEWTMLQEHITIMFQEQCVFKTCSWSMLDLEYYSRSFMLQEHGPRLHVCSCSWSLISGQNLRSLTLLQKLIILLFFIHFLVSDYCFSIKSCWSHWHIKIRCPFSQNAQKLRPFHVHQKQNSFYWSEMTSKNFKMAWVAPSSR